MKDESMMNERVVSTKPCRELTAKPGGGWEGWMKLADATRSEPRGKKWQETKGD